MFIVILVSRLSPNVKKRFFFHNFVFWADLGIGYVLVRFALLALPVVGWWVGFLKVILSVCFPQYKHTRTESHFLKVLVWPKTIIQHHQIKMTQTTCVHAGEKKASVRQARCCGVRSRNLVAF